jgi:hypothetical protein
MTLNTDGISYGSGNYIIYSSSSYGSLNKHPLFDYNLDHVSGSAFQGSQYLTPEGTYNGSNYIVLGYTGDWIILKFPTSSVILTKIVFKERSTLLSRAPAEWKTYGSNNGIDFIELSQASQTVRLLSSDYINRFYTKSFINSTSYQYIGITINKVIGGINSDMVNFSELQFFGKENNNFQSDWNSTIINKPDLSLYATSTNLNGLSTNSTVSINNLNTTSTTILIT